MKITKKSLLTMISLIAVLSIALVIVPMMVHANETSPEWVADYTVTAGCGTAETALGAFNGSTACIHVSSGGLHYCTANFPYFEMQCAVYDIFMNTVNGNSQENVNAAINGTVFIDLDTALAVKSIDVHTHTRSKDDTPTVQGVQYFTELTYFVFDGDGLYDGRYDGDDTLKSIDLSKNTKITELRLEYVSMESVDLSANTEIVDLVLIHSTSSASSRENGFKGLTRFKSLDLSKLTKLEDLTIYDEDIEALDLSGNTKLTRLDLRLLQKLKTIDISKNDALENLYVSRTGLAEFDLGSKPNLTKADIIINADLKSVNLTGCTALRNLGLATNALENVDFSKNTALESLNVNQNQFKTLDLSKNTELTSLSCQQNLLTHLDLSQNTKIGSASLNTQYPIIGSVTDDVLDLKTFEGFDLSKVQEKSDSNGGTYQFNVKRSTSYSATSNYKNVGEDLLLNVDGDNCYVYYSYLVGTKSNGTEIYMSVELEIENKYYTVKCETPGVVLKEFNYSAGAGEQITNAKRGNSLSIVVEVDASSPLYGKKIAVFSQAAGGDKVLVSDYEYNGTVYYSVSSVNAPTSIIVEEGHDCVFTEWAPVENTSQHERHCTVGDCTVSETGWCSDHYGAEYHADMETMQKDCTVCGRNNTWKIDTSKSVHVAATSASCDAPGNIEFWICGHCDKYFSDADYQHEVTPAQVYISPLEHNFVNSVCSECGYAIKRALFEQSPDDVFSSDDCYLYVLIGVGRDGKLYAMGEATGDGRRYGVEIPAAQIDANGIITLNSDQAEFMDFEYYFEDGATATTLCSFLVDGNYMTARNGRIYTFPESRLDDHGNPRPFDFRQADYGDESGLGYIFCDLYDPSDYSHFNEYITFNPDTCCFEACAERQDTIYLYRQVCEHESIHVKHTYPVAPTCTEQGYGGNYWFCSMCETYFTDEACTTELVLPEGESSVENYFLVPALGHKFASNGVCENCGMLRPVYNPVTSLEQFDQLSENAYYILVFKDGDKTYAAYIPNLNIYDKVVNADSDSDGIIDLLEADEDANGVPDIIENYIDTYWGGADGNSDGIVTLEEINNMIGDMTGDAIVNMDDYKLFFEYNVEMSLYDEFCDKYAINHSNVVEVTVSPDGSITITDEGAMEFQMMASGVWGGMSYNEEDLIYAAEIYGINLEIERIRAAWIPNYWFANSGSLGAWGDGDHFMMQDRCFGDHFTPGITDNKNWKIRFDADGTALFVCNWTDFDDIGALQLVKYTDENGNECVMMVGCDSERWMYSEFLANCTVISGAYLYASEPVYAVPPHECVWSPWEDDDVTDTHTRHCTVEDCNKSQSEAHHWDAGDQTEAPTCTESGTILYTCPDCDATKEAQIPALEHDWGEWSYYSVDSHIRSCKRENCDAEDHGAHEWGAWTSVDERTHKMTCSVCHGEQSGEHDWNDGFITKEPTEWEEGVKTYTCNTCFHIKTETLDKLVHECVWTDWYPDGDENHKRDCMDDHCDEFETLPHSWDDGVVTKDPSCKETGVKTYACQTCLHTKTEELPITDHAWGDWVPNEDGLTHSRECDGCEKSENADHRFGAGEVTQAPTHEAVGEIKYICEDCFYERTEDIPMLTEHSWDDWVVNKQDMENTHIRFCICNESQTAPHNFGEGSITVLPTDNSIHIEYVCEDCGYKKDVAANGTVVSFTNCEGLNMNPIVFVQLNGEETFTLTLPTAADVAERDGFKLIGWTASIDGVTYALGAETVIPFEGNSSIVFTAEWAQVLGEGEHKLAAGEAYTTEMDQFALRGEEDTIYSGNQVFYVPKDGLYALIPAQNDEEVQ